MMGGKTVASPRLEADPVRIKQVPMAVPERLIDQNARKCFGLVRQKELSPIRIAAKERQLYHWRFTFGRG